MRQSIHLNKTQIDRISEFTANLSLIFFASLVLPSLMGSIKLQLTTIVLGFLLTIGSFGFSIFLLRGKK